MKYTLAALCLFTGLSAFGQTENNDSLFSRMRGIHSTNGIDFYNVDGFEITSQPLNADFSEKSILKKFKKYGVKELGKDSLCPFPNFYATRSEEAVPGTTQYITYYFTAQTAITVASFDKQDNDLARRFVQLVQNKSIPPHVYESLEIDSISFAGRKLHLGRSCRWMGVNNVQCPYYGQMSWSVLKTQEDASQHLGSQYNIIKGRKGGKIVTEEMVNVIFEGTEVKAKKAVYDFKGVTSVLAGMSGGKTLTVYFVAAPVREYYVSCVMSFWNNDAINPSGLPPLLEQVMKLK